MHVCTRTVSRRLRECAVRVRISRVRSPARPSTVKVLTRKMLGSRAHDTSDHGGETTVAALALNFRHVIATRKQLKSVMTTTYDTAAAQ